MCASQIGNTRFQNKFLITHEIYDRSSYRLVKIAEPWLLDVFGKMVYMSKFNSLITLTRTYSLRKKVPPLHFGYGPKKMLQSKGYLQGAT